jgi:phage tail-like protein
MESPQSDRRSFLKTVGGAGAALAVISSAKGDQTEDGPVELQAIKGNLPVSRFSLSIDGKNVGYISSSSGGNAYAEVVTQKISVDPVAKKSIANLKYEDITLAFGTGMSKALYEWISDTLNFKSPRHAGRISAGTSSLKEQFQIKFDQALITEVGFPAMDASSKDAARMTIKLAPESTRRTTSDGASQPPVNTKAVKSWISSNFLLEIDGLDCSKVSKIDAFTVKLKVADTAVGDGRDVQAEPGQLEFPNLVVTLPESGAETFFKWHEDFVIKGNNSENQEKGGTLYWLTTDRKFQIGSVQFFNLGIFRLTPDPLGVGSDTVRRVKAEMYCEKMVYKFFAAE